MSIKYNGGYIPAVGADGTTLVANSSASTGVSWAGPSVAAGKNKIINGDFLIAQRGTSFTNPANGDCTLDRWRFENNGTGTVTISQQAFTPGAAPVAGYESSYFLRMATTAVGTSTTFDITQRIENVTTFAGQTVTVSFFAKADSARTVQPIFGQGFGSGGSGSVYTFGSAITLTTSWARYTQTIAVPSISGKTVGAGSFLQLFLRTVSGASAVIDLWGVQVEAGSVATPFTTATGTLSGELTACQRYYYRVTAGVNDQYLGSVAPFSSTGASGYAMLPVPMRQASSIIEYSGLQLTKAGTGSAAVTSISAAYYVNSTNVIVFPAVASGLTAGEFRFFSLTTSGTSYFGISAEL